MPPHVLMNFRGFPPGCGNSVANFLGWDAHEARLHCPDDVSGDLQEDEIPGGAQYKMCCTDFKCFYITYNLSKIGKIIKLLFRSCLQLLYTRLKFYKFLIKLSTGFVYCFALSFRAGYCICCVVLFWRSLTPV